MRQPTLGKIEWLEEDRGVKDKDKDKSKDKKGKPPVKRDKPGRKKEDKTEAKA